MKSAFGIKLIKLMIELHWPDAVARKEQRSINSGVHLSLDGSKVRIESFSLAETETMMEKE